MRITCQGYYSAYQNIWHTRHSKNTNPFPLYKPSKQKKKKKVGGKQERMFKSFLNRPWHSVSSVHGTLGLRFGSLRSDGMAIELDFPYSTWLWGKTHKTVCCLLLTLHLPFYFKCHLKLYLNFIRNIKTSEQSRENNFKLKIHLTNR